MENNFMGDPFEATRPISSSVDVSSNDAMLEIVDFWAPWCGPCRMLSPVLDELANEYDGLIKVTKINTDENPEIANENSVRSIPHLLYKYNGETVLSKIGAYSKNYISDIIENILYENSGAKFFNGGVQCDTWRGHCSCGAAHGKEDRPSLGFYTF